MICIANWYYGMTKTDKVASIKTQCLFPHSRRGAELTHFGGGAIAG